MDTLFSEFSPEDYSFIKFIGFIRFIMLPETRNFNLRIAILSTLSIVVVDGCKFEFKHKITP